MKNSIFFWLLVGITIFALPMTQTRAIFLIVFLELILLFIIIMALRPKGKRLSFALRVFLIVFILVLISFAIMKVAFGERFDFFITNVIIRLRTLGVVRYDISAVARITQSMESLKIARENIFFGKGLGFEWHSLKSFGSTGIDNVYFTLLGNYGLTGLIVYLSILALWMQRSIYSIKHRRKIDCGLETAFVSAQPLIIFGIFASGFTEGSYYYTPSTYILLIVFAMTTERIYLELKHKISHSAENLSSVPA